MKIRSITCFFDPRAPQAYEHLDNLAALAKEGAQLYSQSGIDVQTTRLATVPFPLLYPTEDTANAVRLAQTLEKDAGDRGFAYLSLGPALPANPSSFDLVIPILQGTKNVFLNGMMATPREGISLKAVRACARIIAQAATVTPDGFTNLRFAALANHAPHGPFFPSAYHAGERPAFALAVECADLAVEAFHKASGMADARKRLVTALEDAANSLTSRATHLSQKFNLVYKGIDFSLAPFPQDWCSLGAALEALGLPALGLTGSTASAAFVADTLDHGRWLRTGFNGLMLPVLEDSVLARRAAEGTLTIKDLLIFSTMCGCGLDTVPLPGETTQEQLIPLLLDVAAIALRLNKPLTARLMPVPGKRAGDAVEFGFEYFAKSRVMALPAAALTGSWAGEEMVMIQPRGG
jgi:hypothetical protein